MEILPYLSQYANLILIAITAIYATLTWMMLKEMREARKTELRPCIKAALESYSESTIVLKIQNIGKGAAIDVNVEYALNPVEDVKPVWKYPLLSSGELKKIRLPELNKEKPRMLKEAIEKYKEVVVKISYNDVFNERHEKVSHINLKEFEEGLSGTIKELSVEENIDWIRNYVRDIKKYIRVLSASLEEICNQMGRDKGGKR
ncbi:MAG: hypothetical protein JW725_02115 [Candidatus Babeliaceae bacterium]|nr:hypothetical protein [Candidatus Babeliaceae bacterium]